MISKLGNQQDCGEKAPNMYWAYDTKAPAWAVESRHLL